MIESQSPGRSVSVVIPVHNRLIELRRAITSALAQSHKVYEIIVVDDASQPPISTTALGCDDKRIRIIRLNHNQGAAVARWRGVEEAAGELVAFLDSDDHWLPEKLSTQIQCLNDADHANDNLGIVCGWETVVGNVRRVRHPVSSALLEDFVSGCWFGPGSTLLIPRRVLIDVGPFDPKLRRLEDLEWFIRFAFTGGRIVSAPIIGAVIASGRRARYRDVEAAAEEIMRRFRRADTSVMTLRTRRRLLSWLHLEQAIAARTDRKFLRMTYHCLASFMLVPRLTIQLKNWWVPDQNGRPAPRGSEARQ
jgi:glycosyltransferase involved in cell wall biosynthesis